MSTYRQLLALTWLIFISFAASAQEYTFKMDTVFTTVKNATYGKLRVIDMRAQKDNIGELKTGAFNRNRPLVTEQPLPELLRLSYNRMITGNRNEKTELLMVLYHFELDDRANGGEIGTFFFDADFFGGSDGKYSFIGKADTVYEVTSGWDVTKTLLKATKSKVNTVLTWYGSQRMSKTYELNEQQVLERRQQEKLAYPIFQTTGYKKGVYYTVDQFLNNAPVDTPFIKSVIHPVGGKKEIYFYYPNKKGKKGKYMPRSTYFTVYDGKEWSVPGHFFSVPMKYEEGEFYANLPFQGVADKSNAAGGAAFIGTLAGGLVVGVVAATIAGVASEGVDNRTVWSIYRAKFDAETKTFVPQKRLN